jgi:hypothetical protein
MRRWELWLVGLGAIALMAPAVAAAASKPQPPRREIQRPTMSGVAYLGEADGYEIAISNPSRHVAILTVDRFGKGEDGSKSTYTQTSYAVRPESTIASGGLRATFGSMGTVNLRFQPSGRTKVGHSTKHCRGRSPQTEYGDYRGTVSLRGEDGYFQLRTNKMSGLRSHTFRLNCAPGQAHKDVSKRLDEYVAPFEGFTTTSAGGSIALILAVSKYGGRYVYLRAAHMQSSAPGAEVQAGALEMEPHMAIGHSAYVTGGEGTLLTSLPGVHPATATLAPPDPFQGEANFLENSPTSHSWTGTLAVSFPGLDLPLTGPTYATSLCVSDPFKTPVPCDFQRLPRVPE